ncbi:UNVERIFIED_CONTAM: hypothetical protein FKN15_041072 [Acipenser sinensis]
MAENAAKPPGPHLRNTIRLLKKEGTPEMSRKDFVNQVLRRMKVDLDKVFCLQDFQARGIFDLTLKTEEYCRGVWQCLKTNEKRKPFLDFVFEALFRQEVRVVNVHMYNPFVPAEDVSTFLGQYVNVVRPPEKSLDEFGMWNGTWRVWTRFRPSEKEYEGVRHPPSSFSIGSNRGYLFYFGQPEVCRKCNEMGHKAEECKDVFCRNCNQKGHNTKECKEKRKCNLCGSANHLFYKCPHRAKSYAGAAGVGSSEEESSDEEDSSDGVDGAESMEVSGKKGAEDKGGEKRSAEKLTKAPSDASGKKQTNSLWRRGLQSGNYRQRHRLHPGRRAGLRRESSRDSLRRRGQQRKRV